MSKVKTLNSTWIAKSPDAMPNDTWTHVVSSWSEVNNILNLYVSGSLVFTKDDNPWPRSYAITNITIGSKLTAGSSFYMDEMIMIERAVTDSEVKSLYQMFL